MKLRRLHLALLLVGAALLAGFALDRVARTPERAPVRVLAAPPVLQAEAPAVAPQPAPPSVLRYELVALRLGRSGRPVALIRANGGTPRAHGLGDSLGQGVRLARIGRVEVEIERGSARERLTLPAGAAPLPAPRAVAESARLDDPVGVIARPPDEPLPSSTPLERAIQRAKQNGA